MCTALPDPAKSMRTELHWSDPKKQISAGDSYGASKTLSEIAAWKFIEGEDPGFRFITILPSRIVGTSLGSDPGARNDQLLGDMMNWGEKGSPPEGDMSFIDVKDCAAQHIAAMEQPTAKGRYFSSAKAWDWGAMVKVIERGTRNRRNKVQPKEQKYTQPQFDFSRQASLGIQPNDSAKIMSDLGDSFDAGGAAGGGADNKQVVALAQDVGPDGNLYSCVNADVRVGAAKTPSGGHLLDKVTVWCRGGEMLGIYGPGNGGKTTLMQFMTFKVNEGTSAGRQEVNGKVFITETFDRYASMVDQEDRHWAFLTCREIMDYSSELTGRGDRGKVDDLMNQLGLNDCARTKAGNYFWSGLTPGQRRRLSVGQALLKGPIVIFLDEPTSGVDTVSGKIIIRTLKNIATSANMCVVATMHNPGADFMSFNKAAFISLGRLAYFYTADQLVDYCRFLRRPVPELKSPADHFVELIDNQIMGITVVDKLVSAWRTPVERPSPTQAAIKLPIPTGQFCVMFRRQAWLSLRDPTQYTLRLFYTLVSCCFVAYIFRKTRDRYQEFILGRLFLLLWVTFTGSFACVGMVFATYDDLIVLKKEIKNGMANAVPYVIAKWLINIPFICLFAVCAVLLPLFAISNFNTEYIGHALAIFAVFFWAWDACAEGNAIASSNNPVLAVCLTVGHLMIGALFSGAFTRREQIIWPFRALSWSHPHHNVLAGLSYLEFHEENFEGAVANADSTRGFECPGKLDIQCFGRTGLEVLESLRSLFTLYKIDEDLPISDPENAPENEFGRYLGIVAIFGAAFKIVSAASIYVLQTSK
jgi:ABC-type multidrug transport system ATPase subunit